MRYSLKSLTRIIENLITLSDLVPTLTANCMQSINHKNCVLVILDYEQEIDKNVGKEWQ